MWVVVVREETYFSINYFSTTEDVGAFLRCVLGKLRVVHSFLTGARLIQAPPSRYSMGKVTILQVYYVGGGRP